MAETFVVKKQHILEAAKNIFAQLGYHKTTMDDIARAVGMKKNSLYYYFPSKEIIFNTLLELELSMLKEGERKVIEVCKNSRQKVEEVIKFILGMHSARNISVRLFTIKAFLEIMNFSEGVIEKFKEEQIDIICDVLQTGVKTKEFKKHDSRKLADDFLITLNAVIVYEYKRSTARFVHEVDFSAANYRILIYSDLFWTVFQ